MLVQFNIFWQVKALMLCVLGIQLRCQLEEKQDIYPREKLLRRLAGGHPAGFVRFAEIDVYEFKCIAKVS